MIGGVAVVVPAHDEAARLGACLTSVRRAADALPPQLPVAVVVAVDSCTDGTERVARVHASVDARLSVVAGSWGRAGAARRAGTTAALARLAITTGAPWLASTDADTIVPPAWLTTQVALATSGWEAVAGVVRLAAAADAVLRARLARAYTLPHDRPHPHVHGANLGVHADAYRAVGGWSAAVTVGEDHHLWRALRTADHRVLASTDLWVTTSHRRRGRAPDGFAARLRELTS